MEDIELLKLRARAKAKAERERSGQGFQFQENPMQSGVEKAAHAIGGVLDYPGGLARAGVAQAAEGVALNPMVPTQELQQKKPIVTAEDWKNAALGPFGKGAPTTSDYLKRTGLEAGTAAGLGFIGDVATDPLTYLSMGGSAAARANRVAGIAPEAKTLLQKLKARGAQAADVIPNLTRSGGEKMYKSGLKALDIEGAKYGKEPVSDLLMKEGVTGNYDQIQKQMDDLANMYLLERDTILNQADLAGGRVSMKESMAPLLEKVKQLKSSRDPNVQRIAKIFEKDANEYLKLERPSYTEVKSIPAEQKFVELPRQQKMTAGGRREIFYDPATEEIYQLPVQAQVTGEHRAITSPVGELPVGKVQPPGTYESLSSYGVPNVEPIANVEMGQLIPESYKPKPAQTVYSNEKMKVSRGKLLPEEYAPQLPEVGMYTEPAHVIPGKTIEEQFITPSQASGFKSSQYNKVGSPAYQTAKFTPLGKELEKIKGRGLKEATESSTGRALSPEKALDLKKINEKLGQILTSKERAEIEAAKEIRKNMVTSVDPLALALGGAAGGPAGAAMTLAGKKAADVSKGTWFRTKAGKKLMDVGEGRMMGTKNLLYSPWPRLDKYYYGNEGEK